MSKGAVALSARLQLAGDNAFTKIKVRERASLNGMIGSCEAHPHMEAQSQCHVAEDIAAPEAIMNLF